MGIYFRLREVQVSPWPPIDGKILDENDYVYIILGPYNKYIDI